MNGAERGLVSQLMQSTTCARTCILFNRLLFKAIMLAVEVLSDVNIEISECDVVLVYMYMYSSFESVGQSFVNCKHDSVACSHTSACTTTWLR